MTAEEFIKRAKEVHGNKYDYSKVEYVNNHTKVIIICQTHGEFLQDPKSHLKGCGCPKCAKNITLTTNEFIKQAISIHGDKYDYSKVKYVNTKTKVCIICPEHGEFWQQPSNHLMGNGCPYCAKRVKLTTDEFIKKAREVHGDKYDYSKVGTIQNVDTKVCIICPIHGEFWQTPYNHLEGRGCAKCGGTIKSTTEEFIKKAREVHGDKYDYSKVNYNLSREKVCIICTEHGEFYVTPNQHLRGGGCPICSRGFSREYKLSLLSEEDLQYMSSHQLIEVIANRKLPQDFKALIYTPENSEERLGTIRELQELLSDTNKSEEEVETEINAITEELEEEFNNNQNSEEFDIVDNTNSNSSDDKDYEQSLPTLIIQGVHSHDNIEHLKPSDDAAKFIIQDELHTIWNRILKANEEGCVEACIEVIKNEEGGDFWNYVKQEFLNEYESVLSIEPDEEYAFPYKPSLMQKLMVYYLQNNKSFGNWCGTGAGKTNAFLFATRKTQSKVTVAIVPNDVIDTLVKSIKAIYPNSRIVVPQSSNEIKHYDEGLYTYIIYNYEKFQGNNGAQETVDKLIESNKIDFVCLDEVQNVKVRDIENASSRSQFINSLLIRAREINPEMRTLAMSATPCINNLQEVRSIIELLTGVEHEEIGNRPNTANVHAAYKALLINGFRYVPKYPIVIEERTVDIDCSGDENLQLHLTCQESNEITNIELILAEKKLDIIKNELRSGTIVYATWVSGMAQMLVENIKKWGYSVESYNGESGNKEGRKEILDRFLNGKTEVLVCSKPISTGVDGLQKHCNKMIIVSLPWTDADYTQLKGRIYRQGSVFKKVEFVIPQVIINNAKGEEWSWDKMRKCAIDTKKSLGIAVVDGEIQETYNINKIKLFNKAKEIFRQYGLEDAETVKKPITVNITYTPKEREYSESYVNEVHRKANTELSSTTHKRLQENKEKAKEYHRRREISKADWIEDPVDRVAEIINNMSKRYTRIIDLGCGMNKLKTVVGEGRFVQGVDHVNVTEDNTVIEADVCNMNGIIEDKSMDVAVFCLSLWGTNYKDYFTEAYRILDDDGKVLIVEPSEKFGEHERYNTIDAFIDEVEQHGFERIGKIENRNKFVYLKFSKV